MNRQGSCRNACGTSSQRISFTCRSRRQGSNRMLKICAACANPDGLQRGSARIKKTNKVHFFSLSALIRIAIRQDLRAPRKFSDVDPAGHGDAGRNADESRATRGDRFFQVLPGRSMTLAIRKFDFFTAFSCPLRDWPQGERPSWHDAATRRIGCRHLRRVRDDSPICPSPRRKRTTPADHSYRC